MQDTTYPNPTLAPSRSPTVVVIPVASGPLTGNARSRSRRTSRQVDSQESGKNLEKVRIERQKVPILWERVD
jgi:hypothetical protein